MSITRPKSSVWQGLLLCGETGKRAGPESGLSNIPRRFPSVTHLHQSAMPPAPTDPTASQNITTQLRTEVSNTWEGPFSKSHIQLLCVILEFYFHQLCVSSSCFTALETQENLKLFVNVETYLLRGLICILMMTYVPKNFSNASCQWLSVCSNLLSIWIGMLVILLFYCRMFSHSFY